MPNKISEPTFAGGELGIYRSYLGWSLYGELWFLQKKYISFVVRRMPKGPLSSWWYDKFSPSTIFLVIDWLGSDRGSGLFKAICPCGLLSVASK